MRHKLLASLLVVLTLGLTACRDEATLPGGSWDRRRPKSAAAEDEADCPGWRPPARRMAAGGAPARRLRLCGEGFCQRSRPPALALCAAQRRCTRRRDQRPASASADRL